MQTQSVLFRRADGWTVEKAKQWAKKEGFKSDKVDVTDKYVRLRQLDPRGFTVKRTIPFGKGISAVVAREETMPTKKKKSTRRPAAKRASTKRKPAVKPEAVAKRSAKRRAPTKSKAARVVSARRRPRHAREALTVKARRPKKRRVRETAPVLAEARRSKKRKPSHRRKKSATGYVMAKRKAARKHAPRKTPRRTSRRRATKVQAWFGDSAGHSKAAKKGWKTRKAGKPSKARKSTTKKAAESRRRPKKRHSTREALTVQSRRRPKKHRARETAVVKARRPKKHSYRARAASTVKAHRPKHRRVRAPSVANMARTARHMTLELGIGAAAYLVADGVDRFLATYNPAGAAKPANKFTSDGAGTLANALNVASPPDIVRYGALVGMTVLPLGGSLFVKQPAIRSAIEGVGIGAGIKLVQTLWSNVLMPMLVGKDTSAPALQKSWIARLYPAEVSATLNMKSGTAAVSSGGAAGKAGVLSDAPETGVGRDAGPFALAGRFDRFRGREHREWVAPTPWGAVSPDALIDPNAAPVYVDQAVPTQPAWPPHFREHHRWGLRGVGDAVQDMAQTIEDKTGVHPAHAVNAAMHAAAEPHDLTQALERALPHVDRRVLHETARHLHPHLMRMHAHARYPREHGEWEAERAADGFPPPEHDAPEGEWREWHGKRAAAGLSPAPHPPMPPAASTPVHMRERHEWQPKSGREITFDRYPTTQQALGIGAGGPATGGNPGQPGLGGAFADAAQSVAASVPGMPLENAVNVTALVAAEPCNLVRAFERAMPSIKRELARQCAANVGPYINRMIEQTGVPLPPDALVPAALPAMPVVDFVPSPPPPSWSLTEAEWHEQERRDWERRRAGGAPVAVTAAATQAAQAAAAPHADATKPAVAAAVQAAADGAAHAAAAAPPGTPTQVVQQAAKDGAKAAAAQHGAAADHPAVAAAVAAAAPAAANAAAVTPHAGTAGVGNPPKHLQVGPPKLPKPEGPQPLNKECGCLDDSPFLGFVGDEEEKDLLFNLH
jgi:hypothetical protein